LTFAYSRAIVGELKRGQMSKLTVVGVRNAKTGRHPDGLGLYLLVKPTGSRSWLLRVQVDKRRRDIGLGAVDLVGKRTAIDNEIPILQRKVLTLAEAREKSELLRRLAKSGRDPVTERDRDRAKVPTFEERRGCTCSQANASKVFSTRPRRA
jgi:hypothetical protein